MSLSNPNASNPNPSERWFEWSGKHGVVQYFDKTKEDPETKKKGVNVAVKLPFVFIVLDELKTVTGYNKQMKSGVTANEVRELNKEPLHVRYFKGGPIADGLWAEINEKVKSKSVNGQFASSVYIAWRDGGALKIGNFRMTGSSLAPWIDFQKARKGNEEKAVVITGSVKDKNGDVEFMRPTFGIKDITDATLQEAKKLDIVLQAWLKVYFEKSHTPAVAGATTAPAAALPPGRAAVPPPDDPEQAQQDAAADAAQADPVPEDDDVPF